jgi:hypothetical protein
MDRRRLFLFPFFKKSSGTFRLIYYKNEQKVLHQAPQRFFPFFRSDPITAVLVGIGIREIAAGLGQWGRACLPVTAVDPPLQRDKSYLSFPVAPVLAHSQRQRPQRRGRTAVGGQRWPYPARRGLRRRTRYPVVRLSGPLLLHPFHAPVYCGSIL